MIGSAVEDRLGDVEVVVDDSLPEAAPLSAVLDSGVVVRSDEL